jgi:hypothetical protein
MTDDDSGGSALPAIEQVLTAEGFHRRRQSCRSTADAILIHTS